MIKDDQSSLSVVIPIHNEVDNIPILHDELGTVLESLGRPYEVIWVDDGSTDGSREKLVELAANDAHVRVIEFRRNYGQTAAMQAGIRAAVGKWIITLDGDLQNDPADIPELVRVAETGYDVVHGWRKLRRDKFLTRRLPSRLANALISGVTRFPIHDLGCTLKVLDRTIAQELELYGEMHRFIPILAHWRGARCREVVTHHRARQFGQTKYGLSRTIRVILDLITVHFMLRYSARPMQWFGLLGIASGAVAGLSALATVAMKLAWQVDMTGNPLLLAAVLCTILAVQFISLGILGETTARIYFRAQDRMPYAIRNRYGMDKACLNHSSRADQPTAADRPTVEVAARSAEGMRAA